MAKTPRKNRQGLQTSSCSTTTSAAWWSVSRVVVVVETVEGGWIDVGTRGRGELVLVVAGVWPMSSLSQAYSSS